MRRRQFIKNAGLAGGLLTVSPMTVLNEPIKENGFRLMDLHVHLTRDFTIDRVMEIANTEGVQFGIVDHPGYGINDDSSLRNFIKKLREYPVYVGLQPMSTGWSVNFSPGVISLLDYVLMDPQTLQNGNKYHETLHIWNFDTYVDDAEQFMEKYVAHSIEVLNNPERIDIFGWPLFLPVCIARDYYTLWTEERMNRIISAAKRRNIAIEINDMAHTPHEKFIMMAKEAGLKFTFGSDTRDNKAGRLDYCKTIAAKCRLREEDFFRPSRLIQKSK